MNAKDIKTIYDVKRIAEAHGSYFFTRATMRFFHDTMRNLGVKHEGDKIIVYRKHGRPAFCVFNPETGNFAHLSEGEKC